MFKGIRDYKKLKKNVVYLANKMKDTDDVVQARSYRIKARSYIWKYQSDHPMYLHKVEGLLRLVE